MNYEIKDNHHILRLTLNTNEKYAPSLELYINDEQTRHGNPISPVNPSSKPLVYEIPLSNFEVGDVITKFTLVQSQQVRPWQTHEGVTVLLDGEEVTNPNLTPTNSQCTFSHDGFKDSGEHDIQAVYVGNNEFNPSWTEKYHFYVDQPVIQESGTPSVDGEYRLIFYGKVPNDINWGETITIRLQLLKGGVPVGSNRVVEFISGGRGIGSRKTNSKGIVEMSTSSWEVGKYKIGGFYTADSKSICSVYKDFTVKKLQSRIEIDGGSYKKGDKILFRFYAGETNRLSKESVQLYVNGKLIDKKTSEHGVVSYRFGSKGTFKFKAVWKGNKHISKSEFTTTITVTE